MTLRPGAASRRDPLADLEPLIDRVYAFVAYRVGDGPDAEDITSETITRALRSRSQFDPRRGEPIAWLIGIARRCIHDQLADRPITVSDVPETVAPGDLAVDSVGRIDLYAAVARLSTRDRELVALRYGSDLTSRQIGAALGMQPNAVDVALHRALQTLRALLIEPSRTAGSTGAMEAAE
jgi:RNA polymerase sigma-70 factor (ECF subfamily)